MRVSKDPFVRRQEIIDTAMKLFSQKGYEATSMTDIAREMQVVSGLCYRYFSSKEELYHTAVSMYAKECAAPIISQLQSPYETLDEAIEAVSDVFCKTDGNERYHVFFHGKGNQMFRQELEVQMILMIQPYLQELLEKLQEKGEVEMKDSKSTAAFLLYGQMPIINDDTMTAKEKVEIIVPLLRRMLL